MSGGLTHRGGEWLLARPVRGEAGHGGQGDGGSHRDRDQRLPGRPAQRRGPGTDRPGSPRAQVLGPGAWPMSLERTLAPRSTRTTGGCKRPIWVRFVLVPGLTDDKEVVGGIAKFAASLGTVQRARGVAVPSDGSVQVGETRTQLHSRRCSGSLSELPSERAPCSVRKDSRPIENETR